MGYASCRNSVWKVFYSLFKKHDILNNNFIETSFKSWSCTGGYENFQTIVTSVITISKYKNHCSVLLLDS